MNTVRLVLGSAVVYGFVACASAATDDLLPSPGLDTADAQTQGPDASAAGTTTPTVVTESCVPGAPLNDAGLSYAYAEHLFPGYSAMQLIRVKAILAYAPGVVVSPPGYAQSVSDVYIRDGAVAVSCGTEQSGNAQFVTSVTFVMEQP